MAGNTPSSGAPSVRSVDEQVQGVLEGGLQAELGRARTPAEQAAAARRAVGVKQQLDALAQIREALIKGRTPPIEAINALMKSYQTLYDQAGMQSMQTDTLAMQRKIAFLEHMKTSNFELDMTPQKAVAGLVGMVNMVGFIAKICDRNGIDGAGDVAKACDEIVADWKKGNDVYASTQEFDDLTGTMAPKVGVAARLAQQGAGASLGAYDSNMPDILRQFQERLKADLEGIARDIRLNSPNTPSAPSGSQATQGGVPAAQAQATDPWAQTKLVLEKYVKDLKLDATSASGILAGIRAAAGSDNKLQPAERAELEETKAVKALTPAQRDDLYKRLEVIGVAPQPQ